MVDQGLRSMCSINSSRTTQGLGDSGFASWVKRLGFGVWQQDLALQHGFEAQDCGLDNAKYCLASGFRVCSGH